MTLIIQRPTGAKLTLRKGWQPMDADAAAYITAVETADAQALEEHTKIAIDNFVLGCKEDGTWPAIKASCILAGARTLAGALVPLVGTAPTNVGGLFVSGDYNRKTGLVGNGSTKYLDSNRNNNADPQNNRHISTYSTLQGTVPSYYLGRGQIQAGASIITFISNSVGIMRLSSSVSTNISATVNGLNAVSRTNGVDITVRNNSVSTVYTNASATPLSANLFVFGSNDSGLTAPTNARLAFYSIGESLNLALLDARVTDLINAFAAAIP